VPRSLASRIERSSDPSAARDAVEQLTARDGDLADRLDADPALTQALVAVAASSRELARLILHEPATIDVLADLDSPPPFPGDAADAEVARWQQLAYLHIAARDVTGRDGLDTTARALAELATRVLAWAASPAPDSQLAVIGMGKLGGAELNYSSDIDLVFVGEGDPDALAREARAVVERAGRCYRVDTALRPEGRDGPLVRSVDSFAAYWERWAEPWEFQALIKARPVAGDVDLRQRWQDAAAEHLWNRPFTADDLRAVRAMKQRTEQLVMDARGGTDRELKRAPGGIRDIEFAAQLLQLVHGRHDDALRARGTVNALAALGVGGYVDPDDAEWLIHAYRFLRRIEHAVQLRDGRQTHQVPDDRAERERVARVVGFRDTPREAAVVTFDRELAACKATVRAHHEQLWFRPLLEQFARLDGALSPDLHPGLAPGAVAARLAAFGFTDVERTRQAVAELTRGLTRSSQLMQQFLPLLLDWLSDSPDPDLGLLSLRRLVSERQKADRVVAAFRDSPEAARRLCRLLGTSRGMGDIVLANTDLLAELGATVPPPVAAEQLADARTAMAWRPDASARATALRRFRDREVLRIAAADVLDEAPPEQTGRSLSGLADAVVAAALEDIAPTMPFAVVALGRYGGQALSYASDLDLLFVYAPDEEGSGARVAPSVDTATAAGATAAALVERLRGSTPAERTWYVDLDLRPEGRDGPVARSLESYAAYLDGYAQTWERQATLRARVVAGSTEVGQRFEALVMPWLLRGLTDTEAREIRRMKARVERERIPAGQDPEFHLKLGRGSLSDVEWTVQFLQLQHGPSLGEGRVRAGTMEGLAALHEAGVVDTDDATALADAYRFCEQARNRLFLTDGPAAGDSLPTRPERLVVLARSLGTDASGLREDYRRVTRRCRRVVDRLFYDSVLG
jgi:glutamate-ammonia-ligase adenylyltransferase